MRIAYFLTWHAGVGQGVLEKVGDQVNNWTANSHDVGVFLITDEVSCEIDSRHVPRFRIFGFSNQLGSLFAQVRAVRHLKKYSPDIVYFRPSLRNLWLLRFLHQFPVVAEIQTNDLIEARLISWPRFVMTWLSRKVLSRVNGLVFVSRELEIAPEFAGLTALRIAIGNGIDLSRVSPVHGRVKQGPLSFLFVATSESPWQGVDLLLSLARERRDWRFHVVGGISNSVSAPSNVEYHGFKDSESLRLLAQISDVGVGTLGLYRKEMQEASPLKVRTYLALGLPVIGAYLDTDLSSDCDYFLQIPNTPNSLLESVDEIESFARRWQGRRVHPDNLTSIDSLFKENARLDFFSRVISEWRKTGSREG